MFSDGKTLYTPGVSEDTGGTYLYFEPDALGTTLGAEDVNNNQDATYEYGSFGNFVRTSEGEQSGGERLNITASSGNLGNAFEEVEIVREGSETPLEIAFNAKYLLDVLATLDGEGLHLELTEPLRPGVVRPADNTDYFCVLMPMQVV